MSDLFQQAAGPQYDTNKHPRAYGVCPKCGGTKARKNKQCQNCRNPRSPIDPITYKDEFGEYRLLPLTKGQYALVDADLYESLMRWRWYAMPISDSTSFYAARTENSSKQCMLMHRHILGATDAENVDHVSTGMTLNNRRFNLRFCNQSENGGNSRKHRTGTSIYKGVSWCERKKKWVAGLMFQYKHIYLGEFSVEKDAAKAYNAEAAIRFGEFARLNVIED